MILDGQSPHVELPRSRVSLDGAEEESLVLDDWATMDPPNCWRLKGGLTASAASGNSPGSLRRAARRVSVQLVVTEETEDRAVHLVGPRLRDDRQERAAGATLAQERCVESATLVCPP